MAVTSLKWSVVVTLDSLGLQSMTELSCVVTVDNGTWSASSMCFVIAGGGPNVNDRERVLSLFSEGLGHACQRGPMSQVSKHFKVASQATSFT